MGDGWCVMCPSRNVYCRKARAVLSWRWIILGFVAVWRTIFSNKYKLLVKALWVLYCIRLSWIVIVVVVNLKCCWQDARWQNWSAWLSWTVSLPWKLIFCSSPLAIMSVVIWHVDLYTGYCLSIKKTVCELVEIGHNNFIAWFLVKNTCIWSRNISV